MSVIVHLASPARRREAARRVRLNVPDAKGLRAFYRFGRRGLNLGPNIARAYALGAVVGVESIIGPVTVERLS